MLGKLVEIETRKGRTQPSSDRKYVSDPIQHKACTSVGIEHFVNNTETFGMEDILSFYGTLKARTTDFVVKEIDRHGLIADLEVVCTETGPRNEGKQDVGKQDVAKIVNNLKADSKTPGEKYLESFRLANDETKYKELLEGDLNKIQIDDYARKILNRRNATTVATTANGCSTGQTSIFHSPELQLTLCSNEMGKEHRRLIHQAITFKYPWLETRITLCVSDCDGDDIEAKNKALDGKSNSSRHSTKLLVKERLRFVNALKLYLPSTDIIQLEKYYVHGPYQSSRDVTLSRIDSKDLRRKIHNAINQICSSFQSSTTKKNEIVVSFRNRCRRPKKKSTFTRLVLRKNGIEQSFALQQISRILNIQQKNISVAGTKDKHSVSYQYITVKGLGKDIILKRISKYRSNINSGRQGGISLGSEHGCIEIGRYFKGSESKAINLGDLRGNKFEIILRNVRTTSANGEPTSEHGQETCKKIDFLTLDKRSNFMRKNGFINYFGLQRLGKYYHTDSPRSYIIGAAMLRREWKTVIDLLLSPRVGENYVTTAAKIFYKITGNTKESMNKLPRYLRHERCVLKGLHRYGKDAYLKSFKEIPRNNQLMYAHSFQSFLWNNMASRRWEIYTRSRIKYGIDRSFLEVGDILRAHNGDAENVSTRYIEVTSENYDAIVGTTATSEGLTSCSLRKTGNTGKYTIFDIVIPLPGRLTGEYIRRNPIYSDVVSTILGNFGLTWEAFHNGDYDLKGAYRSFMTKPGNFSWNIIDAETIKLDFELPSSSYATVCLRELMKNDMIMACDSDYSDWKEFLHSVKQSLLETAGQTRSAKRPLDIEEGNEKSAKKQK
eukprot:g13533.t1